MALPLVKKYEALLLLGIRERLFTDMERRQIKKVSSNGTIQIIAGSGEQQRWHSGLIFPAYGYLRGE